LLAAGQCARFQVMVDLDNEGRDLPGFVAVAEDFREMPHLQGGPDGGAGASFYLPGPRFHGSLGEPLLRGLPFMRGTAHEPTSFAVRLLRLAPGSEIRTRFGEVNLSTPHPGPLEPGVEESTS
jgi:hypothetical protein